ncbi:MAG TPA: SRPBCC family protein [Gemmataceae bacterium]|nr:SRPBCC family protein [Gemmataceae bacterium]
MTNTLADKLAAFDPNLPLSNAHTIPSQWYIDPEVHDAERHAIFGSTWQALGRADQVAEPGSFFTIDLAGDPILVLRDQQGILRAFYNVCRHKASQVINETQGKLTKLRCRYHGWTYDLAGALRGTPEFDGVEGFCREHNGLVPLAVEAWGPLVFVNAAPSNQIKPLVDFLAPLPDRTANLGLEHLWFVQRREYEIACNWKVFVDNYLDGGYHVNTVHPALAGALDYSRYRTEIIGNTSVQSSPIIPSDDPAIAKVRTGDHAYYWWIFPNLMINMYSGVMDANVVLPLGPERCKVIFDFYFARTDGPDARQFIDQSMAVAHQVQLEDGEVCEQVQRGLRSRSYSTGRFSVRREAAGYHFHRLLASRLQAACGQTPAKENSR